ncbi:Hypothetical protein, putative, partial [Bodo saltans]
MPTDMETLVTIVCVGSLYDLRASAVQFCKLCFPSSAYSSRDRGHREEWCDGLRGCDGVLRSRNKLHVKLRFIPSEKLDC